MGYVIRATPEVEIDGKAVYSHGVPSKEKSATGLALGTERSSLRTSASWQVR